MPRSSKDIAKRLRFDHRPRRDAFRRFYLIAVVAACLGGAATWMALNRTRGERQYLPGPVSPAHATFGNRCAHCHVAYASVPDGRCLDCHAPRVHSPFEVATPACRDCHVEHRAPDLLLAVSDRACIDCHAALQSSRTTAVATKITGLADHPEFAPLQAGQSDTTALRFNHALHLGSEDVLEADTRQPLSCASCHVVAADGRFMVPIHYETHCRRCHELKVPEAPSPIGELEAPHDIPQVVRDGLISDLLVLGAQQPKRIFADTQSVFIPGYPPRGPIDESKSLQEFQRTWVARLEAELYKPFVEPAAVGGEQPHPSLLENNKHCFLCHLQGADGAAGGLPIVQETRLPHRWLLRAEFSHRRHDKLPCESCHADVRRSDTTEQTNLPGLRACLDCHVDALPQSAGTECTLCHLYHDISKHPERRPTAQPMLTRERLLGRD